MKEFWPVILVIAIGLLENTLIAVNCAIGRWGIQATRFLMPESHVAKLRALEIWQDGSMLLESPPFVQDGFAYRPSMLKYSISEVGEVRVVIRLWVLFLPLFLWWSEAHDGFLPMIILLGFAFLVDIINIRRFLKIIRS